MENQRVLFVTGASSELGCRLICNVADQFDLIIAHYNSNDKELLELHNRIGDKMHIFQADFSKEESIEKMLEEIDSLGVVPTHIVHLPSEKMVIQKFHKTQIAQYEMGFRVGVLSIVQVLKHFLPLMSKRKYGKVIFMLTSLTVNTVPKYQAPYVTSKYALLGLMKDLAQEYAEKGISINGISPDMIETKFLSEIPQLLVEQNASKSPLGRNLNVDDVIPKLEYLLSNETDMICGQNIEVSGADVKKRMMDFKEREQ